jgi:hypothetical protein
MSSAPAPRPQRDAVEASLRRFEDMWKGGTVPPLVDYLPPLSANCRWQDDRGSREQIIELIGIDLEYRWRSPTEGNHAVIPAHPRLEDYAAAFPQLGSVTDWPAELIMAEYDARRLASDRIDPEEFTSRFPVQCQRLGSALNRRDAELFPPPSDAEAEAAPAAPVQAPVTLLESLQSLELLSLEQLTTIRTEISSGKCASGEALLNSLQQRGWLTAFQAEQLAQGRGAQLIQLSSSRAPICSSPCWPRGE